MMFSRVEYETSFITSGPVTHLKALFYNLYILIVIYFFLDCSRPALEPRFPFMYANDSWPGKVSSFNASITEDIYAGNQKYYSKGTVTFTPPQDGECYHSNVIIWQIGNCMGGFIRPILLLI